MSVRIGLIGTGYWGPNVARAFADSARASLVALCDVDPQHLARTAARHPHARTVTDPGAILGDPDVDAVAISTPTSTHFELARAALEAGKHVLVEKPLARTVTEADALIEAARAGDRILMVGHVFEYHTGILAMKRLIDEGEIGEVYYLAMERTNLGPVRTDVNALWDLAAHDVSILRLLMGKDPDAVSATGQAYLNREIEDVVFATFAYDSGVKAHLHASWLNPRKVREITVVGSDKMLIWNDLDMQAPVRVVDKRVALPPPGAAGGSYLDFKTLCVNGGTQIPPITVDPPLSVECEHFLDCIVEHRTPRSDGAAGRAVVRLLEAASLSMRRQGALVRLEAM